MALIWFVAAVVLSALGAALLLRAPPFVGAALYALITLGVAAVKLGGGGVGGHVVVGKVFIVLVAITYISSFRGTRIHQRRWGRALGVLIFSGSILQLAVTELAHQTTGNGLAGVLLVVTIALPHRLRLEEGRYVHDMGLDWVVAYSVWGAVYGYVNRGPEGQMGSWAVWAAATVASAWVVARGRQEAFTEARVYTLGLFTAASAVAPDPPVTVLTPELYAPQVAMALHGVALVAVGVVIVRSVLEARQPGPPRNLVAWAARKVMAGGGDGLGVG
ncbi:MAG: hypothetical protein H6739_13155 [Alphaproteobacteria bacterium]|nr:hypothetical protein [Alphaproteobacteria bacterium]